mgnify:CR=1 FL=1
MAILRINDYSCSGNLVKNPEVFQGTNKSHCYFTLAIDNGYWSKQKQEWVNQAIFMFVNVHGNAMEKVMEQCMKGTQVYLKGSLDQMQKEGQQYASIIMKAFTVQVLDRAKSTPRRDGGGQSEIGDQLGKYASKSFPGKTEANDDVQGLGGVPF